MAYEDLETAPIGTIVVSDEPGPPLLAALKIANDTWTVTGIRGVLNTPSLFHDMSTDWKEVQIAETQRG